MRGVAARVSVSTLANNRANSYIKTIIKPDLPPEKEKKNASNLKRPKLYYLRLYIYIYVYVCVCVLIFII